MLLATREQLPTALALLELDGVAQRMVLCTPDLSPEQLAGVAATAQADAIVLEAHDAVTALAPASLAPYRDRCHVRSRAPRSIGGRAAATEWILLTSGNHR